MCTWLLFQNYGGYIVQEICCCLDKCWSEVLRVEGALNIRNPGKYLIDLYLMLTASAFVYAM